MTQNSKLVIEAYVAAAVLNGGVHRRVASLWSLR